MLIFEIVLPGATAFFLYKLSSCSLVTSGIHSLECKVTLDSRWICVSTLHFYILTFKYFSSMCFTSESLSYAEPHCDILCIHYVV